MSTLLVTKLLPPRPPQAYILRGRLHDRLNSGQSGKLTLIHAAPGYGKTTLAAAWLRDRQQTEAEPQHAWLTLESYDNDLTRFLNYFIAAWQQIDPAIGRTAATTLTNSQQSPVPIDSQLLLNQLINELADRPARCILVLDDWHLVENGAIQGLVQYWIEHVPPHIHTIITSRTLPDMPLARWRVRGQLTEIGAPDLQFTPAEVGRFLREGVRLALSDGEIAQLTAKTEGWIASLQLAALSLQGSDDYTAQIAQLTGSSRHLMAYLVDEVMSRQPAGLRQFLLEVAILDRFSAALCDAVTGRDDSYAVLDDIDRRNLFVKPLDESGTWYRFHPLFADYLRSQLAREQPERLLANHGRAFDWLAGQGLTDEAMEHGIAAERYDDVASLLDRDSDNSIWRRGRSATVYRWCAALPGPVLAAHPEVALAFGWAHVFLTRYSELAVYLGRLRTILAQERVSAEIDGEVTALEAEVSLYHGDIDATLRRLDTIDYAALRNRWLQAMLRQIHGYALRIDGAAAAAVEALTTARQMIPPEDNYPLWLYATSDLAEAKMILGDLNAAERLYQALFASTPAGQFGTNSMLDFAFVGYGSLLLKRNQLDDALDHVQRGLAISRTAGQDRAVTRYGLSVLARIRQAQGAWEDVLQIMGQLEAASGSQRSEREVVQMRALEARLYLLQGQVEPVDAWAAGLNRDRPALIPRLLHHTVWLIYARRLLQRDPVAALDQLAQRRAEAEVDDWRESLLEITLLQATAYQRLNQSPAALGKLRSALALAQPSGYVHLFVELASDLAPLLRSLSREGAPNPFIGRIQAAFLPTGRAQPLIEPLSARELEILQLVAGGLSNPEIAQRLIIATGTVARHTNNIFGKLGVRNRTEASVRARQLGLI